MLGATKPADSAPGTIRGDYAIEVGRNICHGSDSVENAEKEVGFLVYTILFMPFFKMKCINWLI